jgi:hypothetical protein
MRIEGRLYVVIREAVGNEFQSRIALAQYVAKGTPAEFIYNRLQIRQVMQPRSIVYYVSFLCFLGIIVANEDENLICILDQPPTPEGAEELVKRKCIEKLTEAGFTADRFRTAVRKLVRPNNIVLPTQRDVYQTLGLSIDEKEFVQIIGLGSIREHYKYSLVTRRVMLPV